MTQFGTRLACGVGCSRHGPTDSGTITNLWTRIPSRFPWHWLIVICILHLPALRLSNFFILTMQPPPLCSALPSSPCSHFINDSAWSDFHFHGFFFPLLYFSLCVHAEVVAYQSQKIPVHQVSKWSQTYQQAWFLFLSSFLPSSWTFKCVSDQNYDLVFKCFTNLEYPEVWFRKSDF